MGSTTPVGGTIAWIGKPGEAIPEAPAAAPAAPAAPAPAPAAAKPAPAPAPVASLPPPPPKPKAVAAAPAEGERLRASPLARKMAETQGIDLTSVAGSGPNGRIVKRDVEEAMSAPKTGAKKAAPIFRATPGVRQPPEDIALTSMRKVIAQRLTEVKPGVPRRGEAARAQGLGE